jgi:hypothetical protein
MMVYNTHNHWVSGLRPSFGILNVRKTKSRTLDLFPSSGERREKTTLLGPLERANLNQRTTYVVFVVLVVDVDDDDDDNVVTTDGQ